VSGDDVRFVGRDGSIKLPRRAMNLLDARPGGKVRMRIEEDRVVLERYVPEDPFEEVARRPADDAIDLLLDAQKSEHERAQKRFEELLDDPPEIKPEDDPNLWR